MHSLDQPSGLFAWGLDILGVALETGEPSACLPVVQVRVHRHQGCAAEFHLRNL